MHYYLLVSELTGNICCLRQWAPCWCILGTSNTSGPWHQHLSHPLVADLLFYFYFYTQAVVAFPTVTGMKYALFLIVIWTCFICPSHYEWKASETTTKRAERKKHHEIDDNSDRWDKDAQGEWQTCYTVRNTLHEARGRMKSVHMQKCFS